MALGIAMNAAVALSIVDLTRPYFPQLSTTVLSFIEFHPFTCKYSYAKYTAKLNTGITTLLIGLPLVIILGLFTGTKMNENTVLPIKGNAFNFFMVYLLQFSFNGFQLIQMSEEANKKSDIPKGMIGSAWISYDIPCSYCYFSNKLIWCK